MIIYLDYVFLINYFFDFIILISTSIILKRNIKLFKVFLGSFIGSLTVITLFINLTEIELFIYKIIVSILMCIVTFKYKDIKYTINNLKYMYLISIVLGGFIYLLNNIKLNFIFVLLLVPIFIYLYIRNIKEYKNNITYYHKVKFKYKNKYYYFNGYLDTGNKLKDPYFKRPIIIINKSIKLDKYILIPIDTLNGHNLIRCFSITELFIDDKLIKNNILVGISPIKFKMEGIDCILSTSIC